MKDSETLRYSVSLGFEEVRLPPFEDILIVGKKCPHGKIGLSKSFELLIPDEFEMFEIEDNIVEAIFVNKRILKKMDKYKILSILKSRVFPYVSESEILKVDFKLHLFYDPIELDFL